MTIAADIPASGFDHPEAVHTLLRSPWRGVEPEDAAAPDSSGELLRTIADVLDIRTVFSRVSEIANKMLPHDAMTLSFVDQNGNIVREAASRDDFPKASPWITLNAAPRNELIIRRPGNRVAPVHPPRGSPRCADSRRLSLVTCRVHTSARSNDDRRVQLEAAARVRSTRRAGRAPGRGPHRPRRVARAAGRGGNTDRGDARTR